MASEPFLINPVKIKRTSTSGKKKGGGRENPTLMVLNPKSRKGRKTMARLNIQELIVPVSWGAGGVLASEVIPGAVKIVDPNMQLLAKMAIAIGGGMAVQNFTKSSQNSLSFTIGAAAPVLAGLLKKYIPGLGEDDSYLPGSYVPLPQSSSGVGEIGAYVDSEDSEFEDYGMGAFVESEAYS